MKKKSDPWKKPYNRYNIYFILERARFLQSHPGYRENAAALGSSPSLNITTGYENMDLPDLASRYANIKLSHDWYVPGKRNVAKRRHSKSHGVASFQEIARVVADRWRIVDEETLEYCTSVAKIMKDRHNELKQVSLMARANVRNRCKLPDIVDLSRSRSSSEDSSKRTDDAPTATSSPKICEPNLPQIKYLQQQLQQQRDLLEGMPTLSDFGTVHFATINAGHNLAGKRNVDELASRRASCSLGFMDSIGQEEVDISSLPLDPQTAHAMVGSMVDTPDQDIMAMWHAHHI